MTDTIACPEAERALIGCLLALPANEARTVLDDLRAEDLTVPALRAVVAAMRQLAAAGVHPDPITTLGELRRTGADSSIPSGQGAGPFLADLAAGAPHLGSHGHYQRVVLEHAWRRRVQQAGERIRTAAGATALADLEQVVASETADLHAWSTRWRHGRGNPPATATGGPLVAVGS